jgi:hypothetical protein
MTAVPRRDSPYNQRYVMERRLLLARRERCRLRLVCDGAIATSADHNPPLALHTHVVGSGCCYLQPACLACQKAQGALITRRLRTEPPVPTPSRRW